MKTIAKGKTQVLEYLENDAKRIAKAAGEYVLVRDDSDTLVAVIAGRSFIGTGSYSLGGKRVQVQDGLVIEFEE